MESWVVKRFDDEVGLLVTQGSVGVVEGFEEGAGGCTFTLIVEGSEMGMGVVCTGGFSLDDAGMGSLSCSGSAEGVVEACSLRRAWLVSSSGGLERGGP